MSTRAKLEQAQGQLELDFRNAAVFGYWAPVARPKLTRESAGLPEEVPPPGQPVATDHGREPVDA